jgi:tungstate transport system ATP-binding protein
MATHDLGEARRLAGDIVLLHRGTVVETEAADQFFRSPATAEARTFLAGELLL